MKNGDLVVGTAIKDGKVNGLVEIKLMPSATQKKEPKMAKKVRVTIKSLQGEYKAYKESTEKTMVNSLNQLSDLRSKLHIAERERQQYKQVYEAEQNQHKHTQFALAQVKGQFEGIKLALEIISK